MRVLEEYKDISGVVFNIHDGKDYAKIIWKMCRPKFSKPFKADKI